MDLSQSTETWSIDDTLFYPLGLINHTTGNKSVFVTWSDKYLMNFIFKKITPTANRCNKFKINVPEEIQDIVILEINTLVLLRNGEVYYFSSIKSIHSIPWLKSGVQCISPSVEGFSLIRVLEDKSISLEIHEDVANVGKVSQGSKKSFDISFDEKNLFDSNWSDERFCLTSLKITDKNRKFMELVVGEVDLQAQEVHIFSISNSLFALYTIENGNYEIKTLAPQVSTVEFVHFLHEPNMILIFLNCGIIEVWYMSQIACILDRYTYINGSDFVHHTFSGDFLYFTDEQRVCRLEFVYDTDEHGCRVVEQSIDAQGMVAVTYEEISGSLVCLNNNNIFYFLSFNSDQQNEYKLPDNAHLFELTDEKAREMLSRNHFLCEMASLPEKIDKCIEEEYRKQELIAVCRKSAIYSDLITASIKLCQHIPETQEKLIYPTDDGIPSFKYFAVVSLKILSHEIFKSSPWILMIAYSNHIRLLPITPELLSSKFGVLIPIKRKRDELIPKFEIQMLAHVNLGQDFVCINIPVKVHKLDVTKLFSRYQGLGKVCKDSDTTFTFKITTPELHSADIGKAFGVKYDETDLLIENLYFLGEKVLVCFCEATKLFSLQSCDPVAVYYGKSCIWNYLWDNNCTQTWSENDGLHKKLLELQCQVEKKYGTLVDKELHLASLKRIYGKLRNDVVWKF